MIRLLIFVLLALGLPSCSPKVYTCGNEVNLTLKPSADLFTIGTSGCGKTSIDAKNSAEKAAVETALFIGFASHGNVQPIVENGTEAKQKHAGYFNELLSSGGYKRFITDNVTVSEIISKEKVVEVKLQLTLNYSALRRDLEQNAVIRKFGF